MNMKKSFPDEKGKKFKEFLDKRGFYIVLLLCIAVVAGTAIFVTTRNALDKEPEHNAEDLPNETDSDLAAEDAASSMADKLTSLDPADPAASEPDKETDIGTPASVSKDDDKAGKQNEKTDGETDKEESTQKGKPASEKDTGDKPKTEPKKQSFQMPINGEISLEYAMDHLVYSKTLEEWRAHSGIDITADRGTPVKAVADGVVSEVKNDKFYGITVVIDHENGLKTLYRNLASDETVAVNQKVKQGEIIGSIGNTAMDESSEEPHLHFEVLNNDVNEDPTLYLPIK